jgi:hypothetical protein
LHQNPCIDGKLNAGNVIGKRLRKRLLRCFGPVDVT